MNCINLSSKCVATYVQLSFVVPTNAAPITPLTAKKVSVVDARAATTATSTDNISSSSNAQGMRASTAAQLNGAPRKAPTGWLGSGAKGRAVLQQNQQQHHHHKHNQLGGPAAGQAPYSPSDLRQPTHHAEVEDHLQHLVSVWEHLSLAHVDANTLSTVSKWVGVGLKNMHAHERAVNMKNSDRTNHSLDGCVAVLLFDAV
eukprot:1154262-Pelagomonas_calceolata.AAC.1